jgi:hypothetical protein
VRGSGVSGELQAVVLAEERITRRGGTAGEGDGVSAHDLLRKLRHDTECELGWIENDCLLSRDAYYEGILVLIEALDIVDSPYPVEVFPDLQNRAQVFAAMRAINQFATEQFYAETARARGTAMRSLIEERTR